MGHGVSEPPKAAPISSIATTTDPIVTMRTTPGGDPSDGAGSGGADGIITAAEMSAGAGSAPAAAGDASRASARSTSETMGA